MGEAHTVRPNSELVQLQNRLLGSWCLQGFFYEDLQSKQFLKWQGKQEGFLNYTKNGLVEVNIQRSIGREPHSKVERQRLHIHYSGKYELIDFKTIEHRVLKSNLPERVGKVLKRSFHLKDETLLIEGEGLSGRVQLFWRREKA